MAGTATYREHSHHGLLQLLAAPFAALGRILIRIAESSRAMREIERLNQMSDEELAARGLTRDGEIRRIFAGQLYL
ncbi:DUF1127 domain-containing protein [Albidovulum inexpectatum]|nr:DUF1127 domain-containing protein [Albidovulum inexpectatum]